MSARVFYRIYDQTHEDGTKLYLQKFYAIKETPKGVWLAYNATNIEPFRFMLVGTFKQFAHENFEDALNSFKRRKARQHKILKAQLKNVEAARYQAELRAIENIKWFPEIKL